MKISHPVVWILIVVWATVFCVPSLNFLFRAQWQGSGLMPFAVWAEDNNTPYISETRLQRFPGDKNVLLFTALQSPRRPENDYGRTPRFLPSPLFPGTPASSEPLEKLRRLEQLMNRYPDDATLVAVYLRAALESPLGRRPEELDPVDAERMSVAAPSPKGVEGMSPAAVPPEGADWKPSPPLLDAAGLRKALQICERGRQLEPGNAFFDWMKCGFLLLGWRDGEALQVLEKAVHKPGYDEHVLQEMQRKVQVYSVVLGRHLTLEEKRSLIEWWRSWYISSYRILAQIIGVHITKVQRRGEDRQALRISGNLAAIGAKMRVAKSIVPSNDSPEILAYMAPIHDAVRALSKREHVFGYEKRIAMFQAYASKHNHPELVATAEESLQRFNARQKQINEFYAYELLGTSYWNWAATEGLRKIGVLLLLFLPVPLFVVGISSLPVVREFLQSKATSAQEELSAGEIIRGTVECGCWAVFCVFLFPAIILSLWGGDSMTTESYQQMAYWQFLMLDNGELTTIFFFVLPLLFGAIYALRSGVRWQKRRQGEVVKYLFWRNLAWLVITLGLALLYWFIAQNDWEFVLLRWSHFLESWDISSLGQETGAPCSVLIGFITIFVTQYLQWRKRPLRREAVRYSLRLFYHSMATWLVVGSVLYLCTLVIALPLRQRTEVKIDRILAVGQVHAVQEDNR